MSKQLKLRDVVRVCIQLPQNRILLVMPSTKQQWHCPGGEVRGTETSQAAAVRETFEETGLHISLKNRRILTLTDIRNPDCHERISFYRARPVKNISNYQPVKKNEIEKIGCFTLSEMMNLNLTTTLREAIQHIQLVRLFV